MPVVAPCLLLSTAVRAVSSGPKPLVIAAPDRPLVRECEALFGAEVFSGDTDRAVNQAARLERTRRRAAERRLSHVPLRVLQQRLAPMLSRLPVSSRASAGVAYTLAYFNVDPADNVRHLGKTLAAPGVDFGVGDTIPYRVDGLYQRHPSGAVLREYLSLRGDGVFQEDLDSLRGPVFLRHARTALRLAARYPAVKEGLFSTLRAGEAGEDAEALRNPIRATLRRLSHDRGAPVATTARKCIQYIRQSERDDHLPSR